MDAIATLKIIEDLTGGNAGVISVELYCPEYTSVGISEDFTENEDLVDKLIGDVPPYERVKQKNSVINYLIKQGFKMISATSIPFFINSKGEITQVRTEVYFEVSTR